MHTVEVDRSRRLRDHDPLVRRIAYRVCSRVPFNVELGELIHVGRIGLNDALLRFDDRRGASFDTYATRRIEGAMLDALRAADTVPRRVRTKAREVASAMSRLEHRLGRAPRSAEVAAELGWPVEQLHTSLLEAGTAAAGTDALAGDAVDGSSADRSPTAHQDDLASDAADPLAALQWRQRCQVLADAVAALGERQRSVIELLYEQGLTRVETAQALGITESRVCQIHGQVVARLRKQLSDW